MTETIKPNSDSARLDSIIDLTLPPDKGESVSDNPDLMKLIINETDQIEDPSILAQAAGLIPEEIFPHMDDQLLGRVAISMQSQVESVNSPQGENYQARVKSIYQILLGRINSLDDEYQGYKLKGSKAQKPVDILNRIVSISGILKNLRE